MSFVHCEHRNFCLLRKLHKLVSLQPFGRNIDDLIPSGTRQTQRFGNLRFAERTVDIGGMNAGLIQCLYLILHQRDQRRDHQCNTRHKKGRHLITDRFTRTRRHDPQHILSLQNAVNQYLLPFPELLIAKIFFQYFILVH